eukprot:6275306-Ditylum_brightwellii.AAC.1
MAFGILGAMEHVTSAGNVGDRLMALVAKTTQGVCGLFVNDVADEIGGHGLVLCGTNGCFGFTMETFPSQPLVGLFKIYLWDVFLLSKKLTMHGLCKEGTVMGVVCCGGVSALVLSMTYLAKAKHL